MSYDREWLQIYHGNKTASLWQVLGLLKRAETSESKLIEGDSDGVILINFILHRQSRDLVNYRYNLPCT